MSFEEKRVERVEEILIIKLSLISQYYSPMSSYYKEEEAYEV